MIIRTPLLAASVDNNVDIIELLLQHGANPTLQDDKGRTAKNVFASMDRFSIHNNIIKPFYFSVIQITTLFIGLIIFVYLFNVCAFTFSIFAVYVSQSYL